MEEHLGFRRFSPEAQRAHNFLIDDIVRAGIPVDNLAPSFLLSLIQLTMPFSPPSSQFPPIPLPSRSDLRRGTPDHPGQPLPSSACFLPSLEPILRHPGIAASDVGVMRSGHHRGAFSSFQHAASTSSCGCCCSSCFAAGGACGKGAGEPQESALLLRPLSKREPNAVACSQLGRMRCLFTFARAETHNSATEVARLESDEFETIGRDTEAPRKRNAPVSRSRRDGGSGTSAAVRAGAVATPGTDAEFEASSLGCRPRGRKNSREITNLPLSGGIAASAATPREYANYASRGVSREALPEGRQRDGLSSLGCCGCLDCRQQVAAAEASSCFWPRSPRFPVSRPPPPPLERLPGDWKRRCWCCNEYGHKYSECTKPFGLRRRCFGCGLHDHTKATCPNCSPNYQEEVFRFVSSSK